MGTRPYFFQKFDELFKKIDIFKKYWFRIINPAAFHSVKFREKKTRLKFTFFVWGEDKVKHFFHF